MSSHASGQTRSVSHVSQKYLVLVREAHASISAHAPAPETLGTLSATSPVLDEAIHSNFMRTIPSDGDGFAVAFCDWFWEQGWTTLGIISRSDTFGRGVVNSIIASNLRRGTGPSDHPYTSRDLGIRGSGRRSATPSRSSCRRIYRTPSQFL